MRWNINFGFMIDTLYPQSYLFKLPDLVNSFKLLPLHWRHDERGGVSNHQPRDCLLKRLFRRRPKKTSKLRVTGLCMGNSPVTGEFPVQKASNAGNVSIWWRHHAQCTGVSWRTFEVSWSQWVWQLVSRCVYQTDKIDRIETDYSIKTST